MIGIRGPALVLRKFRVEPGQLALPTTSSLVEIEGRKPGLVGWLLALIGIEAVTSLIITQRDVRFRSGSLFGQLNSMMPMTAVASAHGGYAKPIGYLIAAVIVAVLAVVFAFNPEIGPIALPVGFGIAVGLAIVYALEKRMALFVESSGGATFGLVFKRSVIEDVPVDIAKVQVVVDMIRELVIASQVKQA
ncbi:MAG: hypothetical protein RDV41_14450 [Planctomycetota bacterium]|nr:hypothetical protein [Planctomycetota bacterium]